MVAGTMLITSGCVINGGKMPSKPPLGQHWLTDQRLLSEIVNLADLRAGQTVLEIGAGLGVLTAELIKTGARVLAVEYDRRLFESLEHRFKSKPANLELLRADIRRFDWQMLPVDYKICANIPYYLAAYLLRQLTDSRHQPQRAVLLLPEDVAQRLSAARQRVLLAVIVQSCYGINLGDRIKPEAFSPPPSIDSRVVVLKRRSTFVDLSIDDRPLFFKLLKNAYRHPRKQLKTNLKHQLALSAEMVLKLESSLGFPLTLRPEDLTDSQWWQLWCTFKRRL